MKTRYIILFLIVFSLISLYLRIILPYSQIFTDHWIKFASNDAYWQMKWVDEYAMSFPGYFSSFFQMPFFQWLLAGIIWCLTFGNPSQNSINIIGAYYPAILGTLTIIPVYFIGKNLFSKIAGIIAAGLIAILPGEWLGRSILGFTDQLVMETLLSTLAFMFLIMAIKASGKRLYICSLFAGLSLGLYLLTWTFGILFIGIIGLYLIIQILINYFFHKGIKNIIIASLITGIVSFLMIFQSPTMVYIVGIPKELLTNVGYLMPAANTNLTTMEMAPILYPNGTFTWDILLGNFGITIFVVLFGILGLIYFAIKKRESGIILLLVWSLIILATMILHRRFAYYFVVNVSLVSGWVIWIAWNKIKRKGKLITSIAMIIILTIITFPTAKQAIATTGNAPFVPSDAWCESLDWIRNNTSENSTILAWWDYGYWIERDGKRKAYVNPSQRADLIENTAKMFIGGNRLNVDYVIVDNTITVGKSWAVETWAGYKPEEFSDIYYIVDGGQVKPVQLFYPEYYKSLMVRLYNFDGKEVVGTNPIVIKFNWQKDKNGIQFKLIENAEKFISYQEAMKFVEGKSNYRVVGVDPFVSPIGLEAIKDYKMVYKNSEIKIFKAEQN